MHSCAHIFFLVLILELFKVVYPASTAGHHKLTGNARLTQYRAGQFKEEGAPLL